ncbi:unnamed protein product [Auanema sp. JU1783]|nr:unnamed protein product [Auanema sp. JU1783]
MSLPIEPELNSSKAKYELSDIYLSTREESVGKQARHIMYNEEAMQRPKSLSGRVQRKMENFRHYVGRSCCSCVEKMPAIVLVIVACLIFALLLALIPAVFILTNAASSEALAQTGEFEMNGLRKGFGLPKIDADDDSELYIHGFSIHDVFPVNVSICPGFGFSCTSEPHIVIATHRRCDGINDCNDASDEENCNDCRTSFSCAMNPKSTVSNLKICIRPNQLCDGASHCPDRSDETRYCERECEDHEISCPSYSGKDMCIPISYRCDGVKDCANGADEEDCTSCERGAHMCKDSGKCIDPRFICDGNVQCKDGSDEEGCDCLACSGSNKALCNDGTCINREKVCNGNNDCGDGIDEKNCGGTCQFEESPENTVLCHDGKAHTISDVCSGRLPQCLQNCPDCEGSPALFQCPHGDCIQRQKVCDGKKDCQGGEDEENCECEEDSFMCKKGTKCIDMTRRCDGVQDCSDNSDEMGCESCPEHSFRCDHYNSCLPNVARCDGVPDCPDGSDEIDCSCYECTGKHSQNYMCEESKRCIRRDEVCAPYSVCPNATIADRRYCADRALKDNSN